VLQCVAVCCSVLQCVAVCPYSPFILHTHLLFYCIHALSYVAGRLYWCVTVCCRVLPCVAVYCSVLQCIPTTLSSCIHALSYCIHALSYVAGRSYWCVAVSCSVCSMLQCVAVCSYSCFFLHTRPPCFLHTRLIISGL